jgi:hypothetical protein
MTEGEAGLKDTQRPFQPVRSVGVKVQVLTTESMKMTAFGDIALSASMRLRGAISQKGVIFKVSK